MQKPDKKQLPVQWSVGQKLLGTYKIVDILGIGGMGTVFLVENLHRAGEFLAMKTMSRNQLHSPERQKLFFNELRVWMELPEHPNLTACRFFRTIEDRMVIFAEYISGGSLQQWLQRNQSYGVDTVLDFAIQLAWSLETAHAYNVIHMDVKPSNVLLTRDGVIKLTDFGLSNFRSWNTSSVNPSGSSSYGMTIAFCSPEIAMGNPVSFKTDMWSWAVTVVELLVGRIVWTTGISAPMTLSGLCAERSFRYNVFPPKNLVDILDKCFRVNPEERWNSMHEIAEQLVAVYRAVTGKDYPRTRHPVEKPTYTPGTSQTAVSTRPSWKDPFFWLEKVCTAGNLDFGKHKALLPSKTGSQKVRTLFDLEIFEYVRRLYEGIILQGQVEIDLAFADMMCGKYSVHQAIDDHPGAESVLKATIDVLESIKSDTYQIRIYEKLVRVYLLYSSLSFKYGHFHTAKMYNEKAIDILENKLLPLDRSKYYDKANQVYLNQAGALWSEGKLDAASELCDRAESLVLRMRMNSESTADHRLIQTYMNKSLLLTDLARFESAVEIVTKAIEISLKIDKSDLKNQSNLSELYLNRAQVFWKTDMFQAAHEDCKSAAEILEYLVFQKNCSDVAEDLARTYHAWAIVLTSSDMTEDAKSSIENSIQIMERLIFRDGRKDLITPLALIYHQKAIQCDRYGNFESACEFICKAIDILDKEVFEYQKYGYQNALILSHVFYANLLFSNGDYMHSRIAAEATLSCVDKMVQNSDITLPEQYRKKIEKDLRILAGENRGKSV